MTNPTSQNIYAQGPGTTSTSPFVEVFETRNPNTNDVNYKVQQRWWNTVANTEWILVGFTTTQGQTIANWKLAATGITPLETLTGDDNMPVAPILNNINVKGLPLDETKGAILFSKSTVTEGQLNAAVQVDDITIGINSSNQLEAIGGPFVGKIYVDQAIDPGVNPVVASSEEAIIMTGAQVPAGNSPDVIWLETDASNTVVVAVQRSTVSGVASMPLNGVCHFDASSFGVDSNGFVTLNTPSTIEYDADTGSATPSAGVLNINGTGGIATTGTGNTITIDGSGISPADVTYICTTGSAVPASGMLHVLGGNGLATVGSGSTLTINGPTYAADSGSAIPASGTVTLHGTGGIATSGSGAVLTVSGSGVLSSLTFAEDSGTATPSSGTITFHGTGGIVTSGSGSTVTINASAVPGVITLNQRIFTSSTTYTPTANTQYVVVEVVGGGGGGGNTGGSFYASGGGGGGGGYAKRTFAVSAVTGQTITVGSGGGAASSGGTSSVGSLIQATGGAAGLSASGAGVYTGGVGGLGSGTGVLGIAGCPGGVGSNGVNNSITQGSGGNSFYGGGGIASQGNSNGLAPSGGYGGGGSGSSAIASGAKTGGSGAPGVVIITEYI